MYKFKVGDKVTLNADSKWADGSDHNPVGVVGTIDDVEGFGCLDVHVEWPDCANSYDSADLTLVETTATKRQALSDAMDLVRDYKVGVNVGGGTQCFYHGSSHALAGQRDKVLDKLFPLETPAQKKLKELEAQQRELANQMEELRKEL